MGELGIRMIVRGSERFVTPAANRSGKTPKKQPAAEPGARAHPPHARASTCTRRPDWGAAMTVNVETSASSIALESGPFQTITDAAGIPSSLHTVLEETAPNPRGFEPLKPTTIPRNVQAEFVPRFREESCFSGNWPHVRKVTPTGHVRRLFSDA